MDRGAKSWVTIVSQRIDPMLLLEIFHTPFTTNNNKKKRKIYLPVTRQKHTLMQTGPSKHAGSDPEAFWVGPVMAITDSV